MSKVSQESQYAEGVCTMHLQTRGKTSVNWYVDADGDYIHVDFGKFPDMATLVLIGPDADRLYEALGQALRERDLKLTPAEHDVGSEG